MRRLLIAFALVLGFATIASSATTSATFAWDAVTGASGYTLYWGTASGTYTSSVDAGDNTSVVISGLPATGAVYVTVTAYDSNGDQSPYSTELVINVPSPPGGTFLIR